MSGTVLAAALGSLVALAAALGSGARPLTAVLRAGTAAVVASAVGLGVVELARRVPASGEKTGGGAA